MEPIDSSLAYLVLSIGLLVLGVLISFWLTRRYYRVRLAEQAQELTGVQETMLSQRAELQTAVSASRELEKNLSEQQRLSSVAQAEHNHLQSRVTELKASEARLQQAVAEQQQQQQTLVASEKSLQTTVENLQAKISEMNNSLLQWQEKWEQLHLDNSRLQESNVQLNSAVEERKRSLQEQLQAFEQQKKDLTDRFQLLANEILDKKTQALAENNKQGLQAVINPFQQSIDAFKKEVQEIHHRETSQRGELKQELEQLKVLNQQITTEAHELSNALRGQKKLQGNWGELILENVLERSGLQAGKDYQREASFQTEEGRQRPDVLVYLPQGKHLVIDAKVSLNAYTRFINAEDETERALAIKEHVQAMGNRIKELADRDYYKIPGLNSPEVVFMFVPIESAFVEALKADEQLFQSAIERNVLVATPTTLLTSLNIVRQLWRFEDQNKHTAALAEKAESVFKKLNTFLRSFEDVKKGLEKATESYVKAEGQLVSGRGNLVKQVAEFKSLAPAIKSELPSHFTDRAELEVDFLTSENIDDTE